MGGPYLFMAGIGFAAVKIEAAILWLKRHWAEFCAVVEGDV